MVGDAADVPDLGAAARGLAQVEPAQGLMGLEHFVEARRRRGADADQFAAEGLAHADRTGFKLDHALGRGAADLLTHKRSRSTIESSLARQASFRGIGRTRKTVANSFERAAERNQCDADQ